VGKRISLIGLDEASLLRVLNHPEQMRNVTVVNNLLDRLDRVGHNPGDLYNFQTALFRCSYRAQWAVADISRALKRLADKKGPDWQGQHAPDVLEFIEPLWTPACAPDSRDPRDWELEAVAAARIVRQLRDIGDGLAWRVHRYDRAVITALSNHPTSGLIVGKDGLDSEIGRIVENFRDSGHFTLMHDLTSVLRHHDLTEVHADGYRELHEVKTTQNRRTSRAAAKQRRAAEAALAAAAGTAPLEPTGAHITRSPVQLRTHIRELSGVLDVASRDGHVATRVGDRAVSALHFPTVAASGADFAKVWESYQARRAEVRGRLMPTAMNVLQGQLTFVDQQLRNPYFAPFSIYPLPPAQRAALICDLVLVEFAMDAQVLAAGFEKQAMPARVLLDYTSQPGADVLSVDTGSARMTVHAGAVSQLLHEMVRTDCFVQAFAAGAALADESGTFVLTFGNERAAWR
jgi:hypothetical protein